MSRAAALQRTNKANKLPNTDGTTFFFSLSLFPIMEQMMNALPFFLPVGIGERDIKTNLLA